MKQEIHPNYQPVVFMDTTTGFKFLSGSTKGSSEKVEWEDGNTYPMIRVEISSDSHPFYTGRQKFTQADGVWTASTRNTVSKTTKNKHNLFEESFPGFGRALFYLHFISDSLGDRLLRREPVSRRMTVM